VISEENVDARPLTSVELLDAAVVKFQQSTKSDIEIAPAERSLGQIQFVFF
jgi:hypothetical protein